MSKITPEIISELNRTNTIVSITQKINLLIVFYIVSLLLGYYINSYLLLLIIPGIIQIFVNSTEKLSYKGLKYLSYSLNISEYHSSISTYSIYFSTNSKNNFTLYKYEFSSLTKPGVNDVKAKFENFIMNEYLNINKVKYNQIEILSNE